MLLTLAIYLDRMEYPPLNELNIHRIVLAGLRVAAKFLEDLVRRHDRYAKVVGVSSRELSRLELGNSLFKSTALTLYIGFLFLTEFEVVVNNEQLADMAFRLRNGFGNM
jgi:Cyclin